MRQNITHPDAFTHSAPSWFERVLDTPLESFDVDFEGVQLRAYRPADRQPGARPGIILAHGFLAHAHCLTFLMPFLTDRFDVVAYDLAGMGDSPLPEGFDASWRGRELLAVAEAAGLLDAAQPAFVVAHSQGGHSGMSAIEEAPDAFAAFVLCDMMLMPPSRAERFLAERRGGRETSERSTDETGSKSQDRLRARFSQAKPHKVRPDLETILERYVLAPPQPTVDPFMVESVARHSVRAVDGGYVWKFDPRVRVTDGHPVEWWVDQPRRFAALDLPKAIIHGEHSAVFTPDSARYVRELTGGAVPVVEVPQAHHHLMLDQPLAFVGALRGVLESLLSGCGQVT